MEPLCPLPLEFMYRNPNLQCDSVRRGYVMRVEPSSVGLVPL